MKDVPGWKTGTWYGEPVYFTLGDKWWDPVFHVSAITRHETRRSNVAYPMQKLGWQQVIFSLNKKIFIDNSKDPFELLNYYKYFLLDVSVQTSKNNEEKM